MSAGRRHSLQGPDSAPNVEPGQMPYDSRQKSDESANYSTRSHAAAFIGDISSIHGNHELPKPASSRPRAREYSTSVLATWLQSRPSDDTSLEPGRTEDLRSPASARSRRCSTPPETAEFCSWPPWTRAVRSANRCLLLLRPYVCRKGHDLVELASGVHSLIALQELI